MMRSLFAGVSGLKSHQTRMDVVGNNIANINTVGFKASRTTFADMLSQTSSGASTPAANLGGTNPQQIGLGTNVASIDLDFKDGSPQTTGKNTDVALSGDGLFVLKSGNQYYYTRDGAFSFDNDGNYVLPGSGYYVQGWNAVDGSLNTNAPPTNIVVPAGKTMAAVSTTEITFTGNLNSNAPIITAITYTRGTGDEKKVVTGGEILQINYYDSETSTTPSSIATTLAAADHGVIYYRDVDNDVALPSGTTTADLIDSADPNSTNYDPNWETDWERYGIHSDTVTSSSYTGTTTIGRNYVKSVNVDGTNVIAATLTLSDGTSQKVSTGYYQLGHSIPVTTSVSIFDSMGATHEVPVLLDKMSATPAELRAINENPDYQTDTSMSASEKADVEQQKEDAIARLNNRWMVYIAPAEGESKFAVKYVHTEEDGSTTIGYLNRVDDEYYNSRIVGSEDEQFYSQITDTAIAGTYYGGAGTIYFNSDGSLNSADTVGSNLILRYTDGNGSASTTTSIDFSGLTQFSGGSTAYPSSDGNAFGVLQSVSIDASGVITGTYTNGVKRFEAQIAVAQFVNSSGLTKIGTSLYLESNNSGTANIKTVGNLGLTITPSALEMSNVDLANELADMIVTQRGFQSNSKIITVADEMLETVVNMKR